MYIDCDSHYWPIDFLERVDHPAKGRIEREDEGTVSFYRDGKHIHRFASTRWNFTERKAVMDAEGFDVQVLIPDNRPFLYELDGDLGNAMARAFNDYAAAAVAHEPRFFGVSWVYLRDMKGAISELRRSVEDLGLRAVKLTGGYGDCDLDDPSMWPIYEIAEHYDIPVLVHPAARAFEGQYGHPWLIGAERFTGMGFLASTLGFPFTYMHSIARLIFTGALERFPKLRFGFFEGGAGWVPFLQRQMDREIEHGSFDKFAKSAGVRLSRKPSEYFDRLYVAAIADEDYLADTVRRWPNHKIITGSDFDHGDPIATWPTTVSRFKKIEGLSKHDQDKILGGNAMELFNIKQMATA